MTSGGDFSRRLKGNLYRRAILGQLKIAFLDELEGILQDKLKGVFLGVGELKGLFIDDLK